MGFKPGLKTPFVKKAKRGGFLGVLGYIEFFGGVLKYEWQVLNVIHTK